jgi:hypothetical protein
MAGEPIIEKRSEKNDAGERDTLWSLVSQPYGRREGLQKSIGLPL